MALILGLDIGTHSVTGAVFAGSAKKFRLVDFFTEEIPGLTGGLASLTGKAGLTGGTPQEFIAPPSVEEILQKVLADRGLKGADVVVAVDAKDCIIREIPVQFTREDQIEKVIPYSAEEFLPTINIEDVILEYLKVGEANGKSTVVLFALRNEVLESRLSLLKRVDVDPLAVDIDAAALFNAFALTPVFDPKKATLLIDMGGTSTKIVLVEDGRLKKVRAFRSSARVLGPERLIAQPVGAATAVGSSHGGESEVLFGDYSIESRFKEIEDALKKLEPASADAMLDEFDESTPIAILSDEDYERVQGMEGQEGKAAALGGNRPVDLGAGPFADRSLPGGELPGSGRSSSSDFQAYLERIGVEVQRTLASTRTNVELICLTGGMSARDEAVRYFTEELDVETIQLDFGDSVETDLDPVKMLDVNRFGAVAIGLAVKELGRDRTSLDFRKGRFRYEHRFTKLKFPLLMASMLCFAFFLQTAFWSYHDYRRLSERAEGYEQASREAYEKFFGKPVTEGRDPLVAAKDQFSKWSGKGLVGVGKVLPYADVLANVADVMNASLPELGDIYKIRNMNFDFKVKSRPVTGGKKPELAGGDSTVEVLTKNDNGNLIFEKSFNKPEKGSKYFDAKAASKKVQEEFQVTLTLSPKKAVLNQLE